MKYKGNLGKKNCFSSSPRMLVSTWHAIFGMFFRDISQKENISASEQTTSFMQQLTSIF